MARKRMIDPGFWDSVCLGKVSREARLLYMGLISLADDEGRLPATPSWLASRLFPYDEDVTADQITSWLEELQGSDPEDPVLWLYQDKSKFYIQHPKWDDYQRPSRPSPSKLPPCPPEQIPTSHHLPEEFYEALKGRL